MRRGRLIGKRMMTRRRKLKNENAAFMDEVWMLHIWYRLESSRYTHSNGDSANRCGCISHIHHKGLLAIASQSSILLTIANSASHATQSSATVKINGIVYVLVPTVSINAATVKAVCASPPFATHVTPTTVAATQGIDPTIPMRNPLQPSTNSSACRRSFCLSWNTQFIHSSFVCIVAGLLYA